MGHFIKKCRLCSVVISQCRCPSLDKQLLFGICQECDDRWKDFGKRPANSEQAVDKVGTK